MARARNVAQYILEECGEMTALKLQKLVYYCQAWALVWTDNALFPERIEAGANGPVIPELYKLHDGQFKVNAQSGIGESYKLQQDEIETILNVLSEYKAYKSYDLINQTRLEDPWKIARGTTPDGEPCTTEISHAAMAEYYSGF